MRVGANPPAQENRPCDCCGTEAPIEWIEADPTALGMEPTPDGDPDEVALALCPPCQPYAREAGR